MIKVKILKHICYTELVYDRVNKKLKCNYSKEQIEIMIFDAIQKTSEKDFRKIGKNYYILNTEYNIRITVNSNTYRVITVDKVQHDQQTAHAVKS
ncbi:MAG: DUF3781 domain-containing protein [Mangrovibacterium sp.]